MSLTESELLLERTRNALASFSTGNFHAAAADIHPEIEWHVAFRIPDLPASKEVCRGLDEVRELWHVFTSAWESMAIEIEEVLHADTESQLLRVRFVGRGAGSGIEVDRTLYLVYRFRDGRLSYTRAWEAEADARRELDLGDG